MTTLDDFQSAFRAASGMPFTHESLSFKNVAVVSDLDSGAANDFTRQVGTLLDSALPYEHTLVSLCSDNFTSVSEMLTALKTLDPGADLICTYRNLHNSGENLPESLGSHIDVLTQRVDVPVLLLPRPDQSDLSNLSMKEVMVVTDHLSGDSHLISVASHFTPAGGKLVLTHVEDESVFDRYQQAISRIPAIPTDASTESIKSQLMHMADQFITSCKQELGVQDFTIEKHIEFGNPLTEYKVLCNDHEVDLLVINSKDANHIAMDGPAYELALELQDIPLLLL